MRTQISQPQRDQIRRILRNSIESKQLSKAKKSKPEQPRKDNNPLKPSHPAQLKNQTAYLFKELTLSRLIDKLELIEKWADKSLDKQQRKSFTQLAKLIVKQEQLRALIDTNERQNNKQKAKQEKDYLLHILEKQQNLIHQSHPRLQTLTSNIMSSGVWVNDLAREMSPKMKFDYGFSELSKKTDDRQRHLLTELHKKDLVLRRLFQRVQALQHGNETKSTFKQNIDSLNLKIIESHRNHSKVRELELLSAKQMKEYKELSHSYCVEIETHKSDYNKLFQDYNQLSRKYKELQQEFQWQMLEKEEWERKYNKLSKEQRTKQEKNTHLLAEIRGKVTEVLRYDILEMRNMQRMIQNRIKDDLELVKDFAVAEIKSLSSSLNRQRQDQGRKLGEWSQKCQKLQNLLETYQQKLLRLGLENQQLLNQLSGKRQNPITMQLLSNLINHYVAPTSTNLTITSCSTSIDPISSQMQKDAPRQLQMMHLSLRNSLNYTIDWQRQTLSAAVQANQEQSQEIASGSVPVGCQTEASSMLEQMSAEAETQTESQTQEHPEQTEKISLSTSARSKRQLQFQTVLEYRRQPTPPPTTRPAPLAIPQQIQYHSTKPLLSQTVYVQTDLCSPQLPEHLHPLDEDYPDFKIIEDSPIQDSDPNDILKLLQQCQQCTLVPQICLLREQLAIHREEIERLRNLIRQHEKEKEEENVFNFRL